MADSVVDAKLKAAFGRARTERVAVIGIGDSNQRFGGHGYSKAMPEALSKIAPIYATDILQYRQRRGQGEPIPPEAPPELSNLSAYWYIPPGGRESVSWKPGLLIVGKDDPIDVRGPLRFHFAYGTFETEHAGAHADEARFRPAVRRDSRPWTILSSVPEPLASVTGRFGLERVVLDVPADPGRDFPLQFMPNNTKQPIPGPFFAAWAMAENTARQNGFAYHTLYASGGHSLYEMLGNLRARGERSLVTWFEAVRGVLNGEKTAVVMIHSGFNDRNRTRLSIGPAGGFQSRTPEGYVDNLDGLVHLIAGVWIKAGGSPDTLHFAFMPSHAISDPDDEKIVSYREAAARLAAYRSNASMIDLSKLVPFSRMTENKFYDKGRETDVHLTAEGYRAISEALVAELQR